ncbi:hypothetical protein D1646_16440 [Pseudoflavonifractor sp. 60]|uniref:glucosyltransferase domain-containing protein n=1 Tax=Pseudoflavonifractor sp. 60 TaxID=2304576 RepID=UPI00136F66AE|nr:glucosyltransferase domain-containing protein [Pseudoflavonifractor sp. 60]NBI68357.1 hypothetical protein [Pseudoflavonifractor sp. 60]
MSIDQQGHSVWKKVPAPQRSAFFSCMATGLLVHLYAFTNIVPNSDGLSRVYDFQQMTVSGRWFLHYASALNNFTQMPMAIGLLSLLFLGLAAALTADVLKLRSCVLAGLAGAVMSAFPSIGYTYLYLFTASAYCLAIFLAVLSVWLVGRGHLGWLAGAAALALSMGIYQAYASVAIALALMAVLGETLDPKATLEGAWRLGLRLVLTLAAGAAAYYVILQIFLKVKGLELLSYLGMDAASAGYPIGQLPRLILDTYKQVIAFFFLPGRANAFTTPFLVGIDLMALALGALGLVLALRTAGLVPWRIAGALAMGALLPLGVNFGQIISPYAQPTPLMKYAFAAVYLAVLLVLQRAEKRLPRAAAPAAAVWAAALLLFCLNTNNLLYTVSAQAHRATESYLTRLYARVEACPGYQPGMEVAIIGAIPADQLKSQIDGYAQVDHYSVPMSTAAPGNKHIYYFLRDWLNIPVEELDEDTMKAVAQSEEFREMPLYPAPGSVQLVDGRVVVKLREKYTPKSDFEIAYEHRR